MYAIAASYIYLTGGTLAKVIDLQLPDTGRTELAGNLCGGDNQGELCEGIMSTKTG